MTQNQQQHNNYVSVSAEPEYYTSWDNSNQSLTFTTFLRLDQYDDNRTHADIREFVWHKVFSSWEIKAGISKVFWGVTESQHLVDVVNQTDNVENIDGEDKLGQPMINLSIEQDWGVIDLFLLPYFREQTFPDLEGRPRSYPAVDSDNVIYESSDKEKHIDYAGRIFSFLGDLELGISYFNGTSREPTLSLNTVNGLLTPNYLQMTQFGLDAQLTTDEWLWKAEIIKRNWSSENLIAGTVGFEYTFVGILDSPSDLGIVLEYLYDDRGDAATSPFQNDIFTGLRFTLNDAQSTEALLGFIIDADSKETFISIEASRRLSQQWLLTLEARGFQNADSSSTVFALRKDDFLLLEAAYFF